MKIVGFGHFRIRQKASRRGRNPQTGDSIEITARKVLTFKPSKGLKLRINQQRETRGVSGSGPAESGEGQSRVAIPDKLYYRIGEVEAITEVPAYVLRYWESEFKLLRPKKNPAGQRLYRKQRPRAGPAHQDPALRRAAHPRGRQEAPAQSRAAGPPRWISASGAPPSRRRSVACATACGRSASVSGPPKSRRRLEFRVSAARTMRAGSGRGAAR